MRIFVAACGVASSVLAIYCTLPYVRSILAGRTKPHQFTWLVFTLMNGIIAVSQILEGARVSALIPVTFTIGSAIVLALSFKFGERNTSSYDRGLFAASLLTIAVWCITKNSALAIWLTVLIDIFATTMMVLKIRTDPHSEAPGPWLIATLAYVFSCMSLATTHFGLLFVRPIYGILSDIAVLLAIWAYGRKSVVGARSVPSTFAEHDELALGVSE